MQIRRIASALTHVGLLAPALCWACLGAPSSASAQGSSPLPPSDYGTRALCAPPLPGRASCLAVELVPRTAAARARTHPLGISTTHPLAEPQPSEGAYGFRPQDLHSGYELPTTQLEPQANPQTIAIVDAYDDAHAEEDLEVYDQEFGLPACTHANGCFTKLNENGNAAPLPSSSSTEARGWAGEIATDVEVAHAVCEDCHILLVEAVSPNNVDLGAAETTARAKGATEISDSWGGPEQLGESTAPFEAPGTVITVASGDDGYLDWDAEPGSEKGLADFPASSPDVVAVGGTRLILHRADDTWKEETVWNGDGATGGGCSTIYPAQSWQPSAAVGCGTKRAVADVAADGDPYTGVAVYDSTPDPSTGNTSGWATIGGTSVASPIVASIFALAGGAHGVAVPTATLYANLAAAPAGLHDISAGSNGSCGEPFDEQTGLSGCTTATEATDCASTTICKAASGYDGPSGVGTPIGLSAFEPAGSKPVTEEPPGGEGEQPSEGETATTGGDEGTHGGQESGSGQGTSGGTSPGAAAAGSTSSPQVSTPASAGTGQSAVSLSGLALTLGAVSALNHAHPQATRIGFAFTLNQAARVRVKLAKQVKAHGHTRWLTQPGSFTIVAAAGRTRTHLRAKRRLTPGRYLLTCTPAQGAPQSLVLVLG